MSDLYKPGRCAICTEPISLCQCEALIGWDNEPGAKTLYDKGYAKGAADERERIAQMFDREAEWREKNPVTAHRGLLFRSWAREIRLMGKSKENTMSDYYGRPTEREELSCIGDPTCLCIRCHAVRHAERVRIIKDLDAFRKGVSNQRTAFGITCAINRIRNEECDICDGIGMVDSLYGPEECSCKRRRTQ